MDRRGVLASFATCCTNNTSPGEKKKKIMKRWTNLNATALLLLGLLAGPTSVARAGRDEIIVHEGGITFRVARYDDGRKKPYLLKFWASGVKTSKYRFKQDGRVGSIKAGTEKYSVWHKRNGSFKKVVRKDAGGRMLLGDENAEENQQIDQGGIDEGGQAVQFEHRRLYACDDCDEAWDIVCNVGVPTICNLRDNETLGTKGDSSVAIACETFGIACSKLSADEACDGQCIEEGTPAPTPSPTAAATPPPTKAPTLVPTPSPTQAPTPAPTPSPTKAPTPAPTPSPTEAPSPAPTPSPTKAPTPAPTPSPTPPPSVAPLSTDACTPNPCLNGGSCELDAGGGHVCTCTSGYGGMACQIDASSLSEFYITMDFEGTWTPERQAVFQSAAGRWAEVVTHVPCGGSTQYPAGQLLITATLEPIDGVGNVLGSAGPTLVWNACNTISLAGSMTFDIDDIQDMEDRNIFEGVILHEMGHVVGVGSLWGDCSTCRSDSDTNWKCPSTVEVYNDLLGDPEGTDADIIELDGGVGTACGHFDEVIFDDELMTGFVDNVMYLSKVTAASLDDTGYTVDPSQVDPYTLPARRSVLSVRDGPERHLIEDIAIDTVIGVMDENGTIVGQLDSFVMQFS